MARLIPFDRLRVYPVRTRVGTPAELVDILFDDRSFSAQRMVLRATEAGLWDQAFIEPAFFRVDENLPEIVVDVDDAELAAQPDPRTKPPTRTLQHPEDVQYRSWPDPHRSQMVPPADSASHEVPQAHPSQRSTLRLRRNVLVDENHERFGRVQDVVFDVASWQIAYLIVRGRRYLPAPSVAAPRDEIRGIDWEKGEVLVRGTREQFFAGTRSPEGLGEVGD